MHEADDAREAGLARLGTLLLESGHSVTDTRVALEEVQRVIAPGDTLSFAVLPEAVFVSRQAGPATMRISEAPPMSMRQAAEVNHLLRALRTGTIGFRAALERADEIRRADPRHRTLFWVAGSALIAVGLAFLFHCPWWAIALSMLTGPIVGGVSVLFERLGSAAATAPFVASFVSTALVGAAADLWGLGTVPLFAVCAPVAVLVPGALITNALLELTASDIVTGAARLVSGLVMLGFMTAGIMAGAAATGLSIDPGSVALIGDAPAQTAMSEGWLAVPQDWFVWPGVVALAVGIALVFGASGALTWVTIAAMSAAYLLLSVLSPMTGGILATGITAMVLFVMSRLLEQAPSGVPSAVSFQPAFLLLVPGTVGLVALASFDPAGLSATPLTFVSLCIGTKLGAALTDFARSLARPVRRIAGRPRRAA